MLRTVATWCKDAKFSDDALTVFAGYCRLLQTLEPITKLMLADWPQSFPVSDSVRKD
jgi:hypothetical protein